MRAPRTTVVGAGPAGLACARALHDAGHEVVVLDKARKVGGRTSTRRHGGEVTFDHGAAVLGAGLELPVPAAPWGGGVVPVGAMDALCRGLADGLDVRCEVLVDDVRALLDDADAVVLTAPAPQAAVLLQPVSPHLAARAAAVAFDPVWAVLAAWDAPLDAPPGRHPAVARAWHDSAKPGRPPGERWVLHLDRRWSHEHVEDDPADVLAAVLDGLPEPMLARAHRWRYAIAAAPLTDVVLQDGPLLVAGDWCCGDDVGAALRSGRAAAARLQLSDGSSGIRASSA